jgi:hypothetical protein
VKTEVGYKMYIQKHMSDGPLSEKLSTGPS